MLQERLYMEMKRLQLETELQIGKLTSTHSKDRKSLAQNEGSANAGQWRRVEIRRPAT